MAPATFLSSGTISPGTVRPFCPTSSATKIWQRKRLISSGSALTRPPPHAKMEKVSSSISVRPLDSVLAGRRRPGSRLETRSCTSRRVLTGAAQGSVKVEEPSPAPVEISETLEEESAESDAAGVAPVAAKTERFKPRIPGQKARREDPTVPAEALVEGAVFTGKVTTIQSFGAFVNFGAFTDGLVHISKLSTGYVSNVSDVVSLGQEVKVTIISVEQTSGRIALSMVDKEEKELAAKAGEAREGSERSRFQQGPDGRPVNRGRIAGRQNKRDEPQKPPSKLSKGQEVEGTVKNKIRSGVFVELPEEEEGFLRYSDIPGGENMAPEASLQVGEKVKATVVRIDRGKIVLTMKPIVDVSRVNRDINKGKNSAATNPFEIAFREFNLIPPEKPTTVEEDAAGEEIVAAIDVAEAVPGMAVTEESAAVGPEVEMISPLVEAAPPADEEVSSESEVAAAAVVEALAAAGDVIAETPSIPTVDEAVVENVVEKVLEGISPLAEEEVSSESIPEIAAAAVAEALVEVEDVILETASVPTIYEAVVEKVQVGITLPAEEEVSSETIPEVAAAEDAEALVAVEGATPETASAPIDDEALRMRILLGISPAEEEVSSEAIPEVAAAEDAEALVAVEAATPEIASAPIDDEALRMRILLGISPPADEVFAEAPASVKDIITEATSTVAGEEITAVNDDPGSIEEVISDTGSAVDELSAESVPDTSATVEDGFLEEEVVSEATASAGDIITEATPTVIEEEVITKSGSAPTVGAVVEKAPVGIAPALVKQLRDETGAGMMDCKRALAEAQGDLDKAREALRKKGLASADKKASRIASEGLIGSYIHDSRIGVLVEVNCETDFVARGPVFKSLVEDVALQVVAGQQVQFVSVEDIPSEVVTKEKEMEAQREDLISKPEAIRAKIVDGRVSKRLSEFALLDQPYIRDDKISVKDLVKQTVVTLGENIKVRRFERYILGEGLRKKGTDFAAEVAAQTAVKAPVEPPVTKEAPVEEPGTDEKVVVSAALVKELRGQTGAGMMDCKKALASCANDLEKAVEFLRKKGLASAEKKASRIASEGLIGTYIHDGRIGILVEVNCETDFVARGEKFKELVEDLAMQVAAYPQVQVVSVDDIPADVVAKEKELESGKEDLASKPEAIRARIVDGRVAKRLSELALLEQPFIKDDKKLVKDVVKETVAALGENIQVRRFTRFNLGEGIEKKFVDFASEVAAQSGRKS